MRYIKENIGLYVSETLARAYKLHVIFYVGKFGGLAAPPPPPYQKAGYATVASFRSPEEWPNEAASVPPTRYTKSPPLVGTIWHNPIFQWLHANTTNNLFMFFVNCLKALSSFHFTERQHQGVWYGLAKMLRCCTERGTLITFFFSFWSILCQKYMG